MPFSRTESLPCSKVKRIPECRLPVSSEALPEDDLALQVDGHDPGVRCALLFGAHTQVCVESEAQQQAAQQHRVVLTVLQEPKESLFSLTMLQERIDFHIIGYWTLSIWSL